MTLQMASAEVGDSWASVAGEAVLREVRQGEAAARESLRAQISRLERRLGLLAFELGMAGRSQPLPRPEFSIGGGGARVLGVEELETVRDGMVAQLRAAEGALALRTERESRGRQMLQAMIDEPRAHRFELIERAELGEPGCGAYEVRPHLGLLGMLFGWWRVKLSSGCP